MCSFQHERDDAGAAADDDDDDDDAVVAAVATDVADDDDDDGGDDAGGGGVAGGGGGNCGGCLSIDDADVAGDIDEEASVVACFGEVAVDSCVVFAHDACGDNAARPLSTSPPD